jgi:hypothetical protein
MACPAVAGAAALLRQWFLNHYLRVPSPAMTKAALVATADCLTGVNASGTLLNGQGFGRLDLQKPFDDVPRAFVDQNTVLTYSGQEWWAGYGVVGGYLVADTTKPVRVALVWTDAIGSCTGAPYVNDLDLEVVVGGVTYKGNVFNGPNSQSGGAADTRNNTECVFLPAGASGGITMRVRASNICGDGVPGNTDTTDQDFALYMYNVIFWSPWGGTTGTVRGSLTASRGHAF